MDDEVSITIEGYYNQTSNKFNLKFHSSLLLSKGECGNHHIERILETALLTELQSQGVEIEAKDGSVVQGEFPFIMHELYQYLTTNAYKIRTS